MYRTGTLALCALAAAWAVPLHAMAQSATPAAAPSASEGQKVKAKKHVAVRRKKADVALQPAPAASSGYDLVPSSKPSSAQARARQNAFEAPDDDSTPSADPRHIGIGLGGANGTTPGMTMGF
jgi:hypothetical protein